MTGVFPEWSGSAVVTSDHFLKYATVDVSMPELTDEDFKRAKDLGNAIDMTFDKPDEDLPLSQDDRQGLRNWLDNEEEGIWAKILKSHSAFPDEQMASLIARICQKADLCDQGWNSVAEIIYYEYMGGSAGPETTSALFSPF